MIDQIQRDPWRAAWQIATSDQLMTILLLGIAAGFIITAWLPQTPVGDHIVYGQWLSKTRARFGDATSMMQALGLFTVTRSFGFRTLLALLAGSLLLRWIESIEHLRRCQTMAEPEGEWHMLADGHSLDIVDDLRHRRYRILSAFPLFQADRWPWADLFPTLAYSGGLLFLVGLLIAHLWGWQEEGLIVQSSERVTLPNTGAWIAWDENTHDVMHSPGIVVSVTEQVPGVQIRADDGTGQPLSLQKNPKAEPVTQLTIALTEDPYFAIPEANLIVQLALQPGHVSEDTVPPTIPVLVQIYRSPPGRLVTQTILEGQAKLLSIDDVTLELGRVSYARLAAVFNPGLWPASVGLVLLVIGLLGSVAWPVHRLWLREGTGQVETTGDLLPIEYLEV
jgi:hypothetical protein